jgi:hypothetical protein
MQKLDHNERMATAKEEQMRKQASMKKSKEKSGK